ncbi:MAG: hypothetical protein Q9168_001432 [Polycauliona sp. 1 TL-2023]
MPQGLPEGLVTTKIEVKGDLEGADPVHVDDIARLWKALFSKISEGGYIRTTPTQSPRSSRTLGSFPGARQIERPKTSSKPFHSILSSNGPGLPNDDGAGDAEETETESKVAGKKKLPPRPPPILKKPKSISPPDSLSVSDSLAKSHPSSAADHTNGFGSRDPTRTQVQAKSLERTGKTARFNSDEVASSHFLPLLSDPDVNVSDEAIGPQKSKSSSTRRKAAGITSTSASRRRPIMRQRSSQTSSSSALATTPMATEVEAIVPAATATKTKDRVGSSCTPCSQQQTTPCADEPTKQKGPAIETTSSSSASRYNRITRPIPAAERHQVTHPSPLYPRYSRERQRQPLQPPTRLPE